MLPRWVPLAIVGALLMWIGTTFERRRDDARRAPPPTRSLRLTARPARPGTIAAPAGVAQSVEQLTRNEQVRGSNPLSGSTLLSCQVAAVGPHLSRRAANGDLSHRPTRSGRDPRGLRKATISSIGGGLRWLLRSRRCAPTSQIAFTVECDRGIRPAGTRRVFRKTRLSDEQRRILRDRVAPERPLPRTGDGLSNGVGSPREAIWAPATTKRGKSDAVAVLGALGFTVRTMLGRTRSSTGFRRMLVRSLASWMNAVRTTRSRRGGNRASSSYDRETCEPSPT